MALAAMGLIAAAPASALEDVEPRVKVTGSTLALAEPGQRFPRGLFGTVKVKSRVKINRVTDVPGGLFDSFHSGADVSRRAWPTRAPSP